MATPRFYVPGPLASGEAVSLSTAQSRQVTQVLRMQPGDTLAVFDGTGVEATARVAELSGGVASLDITGVSHPERMPPVALTVGLAALRGDRFEVAAQKLTEIGVSRIVPLSADRSVIPFNDARAWARRLSRLQRIVVEAAEQCERVTLPEISDPLTLAELLEQEPVVALVERASAPTLLDIDYGPTACIAIGPEGGWSPAELQAIERGARAVASLGTLILRAETAAIVAAGTIVQQSWQRATNRGE